MSLEELLQEVRGEMLRGGDHESAGAVAELIAASVALDELDAAVRRRDDDAATFHARMLERLLASVGTYGFRVTERER
ncbi:hypothetical protein [Lentzea sp.]|uniref:hypothetical protein n=1 Tax=Lentzea sp. TaxID=56099 RepID=UPI002B5FDC8C|nr:hypothetical protein [Lentzea sp.]HUQ54844.1 hypothetical protein [Lentzea sp.]